jgi:integrase
MNFSISLTKRTRTRTSRSGAVVVHTRYVLNYRDPATGRRRQEFFELQKEAQARRSELIRKVGSGRYVDERTIPTIAEATDHWLRDKETRVKGNTLAGYKVTIAHIQRPLGGLKVDELATARIREWYREISEQSGACTANRAKSHLKSILALAEEDFGVRAPAMPGGLGRGRQKPKKAILGPPDIARIIEAALGDPVRGIYYAFPFLAGTRPSEQLGLLWEDVDFEANVIRIRRIQERDGTLTEMTKTEAGTREIPMGRMLRDVLLGWREKCPRKDGILFRVFPGPGRIAPLFSTPRRGGGPLLYHNWRRRYWRPVFKRLALPYVTPHSARHSFISTMQSRGIEVGLVAKLAGHANAVVTLGYYTQAVRGGEVAISYLEDAYGIQPTELVDRADREPREDSPLIDATPSEDFR